MTMSVTPSLLFSLFLLIHTSNGFDITQILNKYPDFSNFNSYLTQTNLASAINSRNTITVLVVDNANLAQLSSKSLDVIKNILSVHILLDYYDITKLQQLTSTSPLPTTFFQTTGLAVGQQGFLKVTHPSADTVAFGSAMPGSTQGSSLVKSVASEPYNISILQISNAIIPQGIDGAKTSAPMTTSSLSPAPASATPPPPAPAMATTTPPPPAPTTTTTTPPPPAPATATATPPPPAPATATATPPPPAPATAAAPPPSTTAPPTPSKAMTPPTSAPPTKAAAPTKAADAPTMAATPSAAPGSASSPAASAEDTPTSDEPASGKPATKGAAAALEIGVAVVCTMALSTLYLASTI